MSLLIDLGKSGNWIQDWFDVEFSTNFSCDNIEHFKCWTKRKKDLHETDKIYHEKREWKFDGKEQEKCASWNK